MNEVTQAAQQGSILRAQHGATGWLVLSVIVVVADQISKAWIQHHFAEFEFVSLLPILDITRPSVFSLRPPGGSAGCS
jgi:hypothetical protein